MTKENQQSTEQSQTNEPNQESPQPEMVELHQASREDVKAALKKAQEEETLQTNADYSDNTPPAKQQEQSQKPVKTTNVVESEKGAKPATPEKNYTQEEVQGIIAENERQKKLGEQKELYIQHRGNELGNLRKELSLAKNNLTQIKNQLLTGLEDKFAESPVQAINDRDKIKEIDEQLKDLQSQEDRAQKIVESQTYFLRHVDVNKVSLDEVADVLKSDGIDERYVAQFRSNPWEFTTPEALVQMGKRAMDKKEFIQADSDRRVLAKYVMQLQSENESLKNKTGRVVNQIQKNLNQPPNITAAFPNRTKNAMENADPTRMSRQEIKDALRNAMLNEAN